MVTLAAGRPAARAGRPFLDRVGVSRWRLFVDDLVAVRGR